MLAFKFATKMLRLSESTGANGLGQKADSEAGPNSPLLSSQFKFWSSCHDSRRPGQCLSLSLLHWQVTRISLIGPGSNPMIPQALSVW